MMKLWNILESLDSNRKIWKELCSGISQEQSEWKPGEDRWSLLEILNHMADIEGEDFRRDIGIILLNPEESWPSFDEMAWIESRRYNQRDLQESLERLTRERETSILFLKEHKEMNLEAQHSGKGFSGRAMRAGDLLASWQAHDFFHIRQITLLLRDIHNHWNRPYSSDYSGFTV